MHHPVASIPSSKIGVLRLEETSMEILKLGISCNTLGFLPEGRDLTRIILNK